MSVRGLTVTESPFKLDSGAIVRLALHPPSKLSSPLAAAPARQPRRRRQRYGRKYMRAANINQVTGRQGADHRIITSTLKLPLCHV